MWNWLYRKDWLYEDLLFEKLLLEGQNPHTLRAPWTVPRPYLARYILLLLFKNVTNGKWNFRSILYQCNRILLPARPIVSKLVSKLHYYFSLDPAWVFGIVTTTLVKFWLECNSMEWTIVSTIYLLAWQLTCRSF